LVGLDYFVAGSGAKFLTPVDSAVRQSSAQWFKSNPWNFASLANKHLLIYQKQQIPTDFVDWDSCLNVKRDVCVLLSSNEIARV
jgi:hypothetical protein